jgi:hypothetical protein
MNNRKVYNAKQLLEGKSTKTSCLLLCTVQVQLDSSIGKPARHCDKHDNDHDKQQSRVLSRHTNASRMVRTGTSNFP